MASNQAFYCGVQCIVFRPGTRGSNRAEVLLGRRFRAAGEGQWGLPGGHVELNESPIVTARRELREETGLLGETATLGATFFTYSTEVPYAHVPVIFDEVDGQPQVIPDERFSALRYFRLDNLPRPLFEPSQRALTTLHDGPVHALFGGDSGASFLKIDMASLDAQENRNRSYTALFLCDKEHVTLVVTWGRREYRGRQAQQFTFTNLEEGIRKLETVIRTRIRHRYYVTGLSGDLTVDRILEILPGAGQLHVVSDTLIRRLLRDDEFRDAFANDFYLYRQGVGYPMEAEKHVQQPLFEV
jgi:8-oxo-dGTP diphosphatase